MQGWSKENSLTFLQLFPGARNPNPIFHSSRKAARNFPRMPDSLCGKRRRKTRAHKVQKQEDFRQSLSTQKQENTLLSLVFFESQCEKKSPSSSFFADKEHAKGQYSTGMRCSYGCSQLLKTFPLPFFSLASSLCVFHRLR